MPIIAPTARDFVVLSEIVARAEQADIVLVRGDTRPKPFEGRVDHVLNDPRLLVVERRRVEGAPGAHPDRCEPLERPGIGRLKSPPILEIRFTCCVRKRYMKSLKFKAFSVAE